MPKGVKRKWRIEDELRGVIQLNTIIVVLAVSVWIFLLLALGLGKMRGRSINMKWQALRKTAGEIEELNRRSKELSSKLEVIKGIAEQKVSWASGLNRISAALPPEIWLTQIGFETKRGDSMGEGFAEDVGRPSKEYKVLAIRGQAVSLKGEEPVGTVGKFLSALKDDPIFTANFSSINLGPMSKGKIGNIDVIRFELFCNLK